MKFYLSNAILAMVMFLSLSSFSMAEDNNSVQPDTITVSLDTKITVLGTRLLRSTVDFPFEKNRFANVLRTNGFGLVNKGVFLAQDVYTGGFKRGDIEMVIDGERLYCACPNRMDSPLSRTNSLEMESITLNNSSASPQCGIGGSISYNREQPQLPILARAGMSQSLGASESSDIGFTFNSHNHRFAGRYASGKGYEDANKQSFVDRYNYKENFPYYLIEGSVTGKYNGWLYRAEVNYSEDIMFPYLMMDERDNSFVSASASYGDNKLYFNYTEHLMDNGLRNSMMLMETDASNLTIGLIGKFYELYYRNWNADNKIVTSMTSISNHLMPDVKKLAGSLHHRLNIGYFDVWGKIGMTHQYTSDNKTIDFYKSLYSDASSSKTDVSFDLGGSYHFSLNKKLSGKAMLDISSQAPPIEYLYIAVKKPMTKPWWSGNPTLKSPTRISARVDFSVGEISLETFSTYIKDYTNLTGLTTTDRTYRTYENINAIMVGCNLAYSWKYFDLMASYTWAENTETNLPLVEVPPLSILSNIKLPKYKGFAGYLSHTYNDAQTRVDASLNEVATTSWHQFDLGVSYSGGSYQVSLSVLNLTNELYYQHMSYQRNPFSTGMRIYEPGRTVMLNILFNSGGTE
ncbi:MAG: hypothetical protein GY865_07540 [candidate division Zixibacteria bacterium]|nr:hypothetical protein [candidate division Zixibacteria bacterium]